MEKKALFEITVTGMKGREWQGLVSFPASGEKKSFQSLLELIKIIEDHRRTAG